MPHRARDPGEFDVGRRGVRAHGGDDETDQGHRRSQDRGAARDAGRDSIDHVVDREPGLEVEAGSPADLGVSDAVGRQIVDQLARHPGERLARLEQRDRKVEEPEQLGLVLAAFGADHSPSRLVEAELHADRRGQLHRRRRPDRSVEVLVELGLREGGDAGGAVHRAMIGMRALLSAVAVPIVLVPLLGTPGTDPSAGLESRRLVVTRAERADAALADLQAALEPGLDAGRSGAAAVVEGADPPGPRLEEAASRLADAGPAAAHVRSAISELEAARRAREPAATTLEAPVSSGEVSSIAAQLEATAAAADTFAAMRLRATGVTAEIDEALAALEAGDLEAAAQRVASARSHHAALASWDVDFATLPVWLETTDEMIGAVEGIIEATRQEDHAAAARAADEFAALADESATADRALRIALGEGGAAVTAAPLGRLADLLRRVEQARLAVATILQAVGR
jgi:hypothetical protein